MFQEILVEEIFHNGRIDEFIVKFYQNTSRSTVQKWIRAGCVQVNKKQIHKSSFKIKAGHKVRIFPYKTPENNLEPIFMNLSIIYETENYAVIDKPSGISTHAGNHDEKITLVNGLLYHFQNLSKMGGKSRPGIVHRLDKMTSGLLIVAKNDSAHFQLSKLFQERKIEKTYFAWCIGNLTQPSGTIDFPIGRHPVTRNKMCITNKGRKAITHYKVLKRMTAYKGRSFLLFEILLETGRTHQIRVHLQKLNCSVIGDPLYSKSSKNYEKFGLLLVAKKLKFTDPFTHQEVSLELPFPQKFEIFEQKCPFCELNFFENSKILEK